ncbi:HicB family protein [Candidatus Magnetoovum chiemensis]|nr:HicB family protein [Candidatus Magnetoovum chiemensis]
MVNVLEHKGFIGSVYLSSEDNILYGEIEGINGSVSYHGSSIDEITQAFKDAVEHYLSVCEKNNIPPNGQHKNEIEKDNAYKF